METYRARSFELAPLTACEAILARDQEVLHESPAFLAENSFAYYLGINTWLIQINHFCGPVFKQVYSTMLHDGLRAVVMRFDAATAHLIDGSPVEDDLVSDVLESVCLYPRDIRYLPPDVLATPFAVRLQLCRYLKRLNLLEESTLADQAVVDFNCRQTQIYQFWSRDWTAETSNAIHFIAEELRGLDWTPIIKVFEKAELPTSMAFTNGAAIETGRDRGKKYLELASVCPGYFRPIFGDYGVTFPDRKFPTKFVPAQEYFPGCRGYHLMPEHTVKVTTAPKAIKGPRLIAVEPLFHQMKSKWLQQQLYRLLPEGLDLNDQSRNQIMALEGSRSGKYATIDLSAASDFVSKSLVSAVFPDTVAEYLAKWAPLEYVTRFQYPDHTISLTLPLYSYSTMGNGLTLWVESLVFWGIARAACRIEGIDPDVCVYGDDIVLPTQAFSRCRELLEACGFEVNELKSYGSGPYRESCGLEGYDGTCIYAVYFPRMPVRGEITDHTCALSSRVDWDGLAESYFDSTSRLVALQHRLYRYCLPAAEFLGAVLADAHPGMTSTRWGDETCPDIWAAETRSSTAPALYTTGVVRSLKKGPSLPADKGIAFVAKGPGIRDRGLPVLALTHKGYQALEVRKAPIVQDGTIRDMVYAARIAYTGEVDTRAQRLADLDAYWHFLEYGPTPLYPDDTCRCIGGDLTVPTMHRQSLKTPVAKFGYRPR